MKRIPILLIALIVSVISMAQTASEKVKAAYSDEEIQKMKSENPQELAYLNFYADNVYVFNENAKNTESFEDISVLQPKFSNVPVLTAEYFNAETFNPLLYNIELDDKKIQYYKIGDTGNAIMIYSNLRFDVLFERHMANQK